MSGFPIGNQIKPNIQLQLFDRINSVISAYAKNITLIGGPGKGQLAKMVNQICIAGLIQALSEAISFSEKLIIFNLSIFFLIPFLSSRHKNVSKGVFPELLPKPCMDTSIKLKPSL